MKQLSDYETITDECDHDNTLEVKETEEGYEYCLGCGQMVSEKECNEQNNKGI